MESTQVCFCANRKEAVKRETRDVWGPRETTGFRAQGLAGLRRGGGPPTTLTQYKGDSAVQKRTSSAFGDDMKMEVTMTRFLNKV